MALELRQQLKLTQQLIMTPQLQMAIKLLQLSRLELLDAIRQELEENPALEEIQDTTQEDSTPEPTDREALSSNQSEEIKEVKIEERLPEDMDWSNYLDEFNSPGRVHFEIERRETPILSSCPMGRRSSPLWRRIQNRPTLPRCPVPASAFMARLMGG